MEHELTEFDHFVLTRYPHPPAVVYGRMLNASNRKAATQSAIHVFDLSVHSLALVAVVSYMSDDSSRVNEEYLSKLSTERLPRPTPELGSRPCSRLSRLTGMIALSSSYMNFTVFIGIHQVIRLADWCMRKNHTMR